MNYRVNGVNLGTIAKEMIVAFCVGGLLLTKHPHTHQEFFHEAPIEPSTGTVSFSAGSGY